MKRKFCFEDSSKSFISQLSKSNGGKGLPNEKQAPLTPASTADSSVVHSANSDGSPAEIPRKTRKFTIVRDGTGSPKNVRFDPDSVQHISLNDDSILSEGPEQVQANGTVRPPGNTVALKFEFPSTVIRVYSSFCC